MDETPVQARKEPEEGQQPTLAEEYANAVPVFEQALELQRELLGPRHPDVATTLNKLAQLYIARGNYAKADSLFQEALNIREDALGPSHPDLAASLNNLAYIRQVQGNSASAEPLFERARAMLEDLLGPNHPDVAATLNNLAELHSAQGHYAKAGPLYERALKIREAALGPNHRDIAQSLNNLASFHAAQGKYALAVPLLMRARAMLEDLLGPNHPDVATALGNLADTYTSQGNYSEEVERLLERALKVREDAFGPEHPDVAAVLNDLAYFYWANGQYARAAPLLERALAIRRAALGETHPDVAQTLGNLAILYQDQGDYARARPLYEDALKIQETVPGRNHRDLATSLNNLANLYQAQGQYALAEPLYERALEVWTAVLGDNHPDLANALNNLACLYQAQGQYARAEPLYERALKIRVAALGDNHPDVATSLSNLAAFHAVQGDCARARPLRERALAIRAATLGERHLDVARDLSSLAQLHLGQNDFDGALELFERSFNTFEEHLRQEVFGYSETRLAILLQQLREGEECLYTLVAAYPGDERVRRLVLSAALLRKGRSLEETADTSRIIYHHLGQDDREAFERLRALRTQFSTQSWAGPGRLSPKDYQQRLHQLAADGDALEEELARRSAPLRAKYELPLPKEIIECVAATLPKNGALVEFIAYRALSLVKPGSVPAQSPNELRYLALLLFSGGRTEACDLGPAEPIDDAASKLHQELVKRSGFDQSVSENLYKLVFHPLVPMLGQVERLFLSPDGQLSLIPFGALHDGSRFLIDAWDISYLASGRDLLPRPKDNPLASTVVVFADPQFSTPRAASPGAPKAIPAPAERSSSLEHASALECFFSSLRSDRATQALSPLPGTRKEAEAIQRLFPEAKLFLGGDATKDALLKLPTPGLLHIGTHGFFEDSPTPEGTRAVKDPSVVGGGPQVRPDNPLLRSGLILTCAQALWARPGGPRREDLRVTALELAGLDLWGTQLVLLSACESGRGDWMLGQGVYGLRRALMVAGTETLVTSLWEIDDKASGELISTYYQRLLTGQGRAAALRQAMLELRQKYPQPYYWAPFIALGLDTPLQGLGQPDAARDAPHSDARSASTDSGV